MAGKKSFRAACGQFARTGNVPGPAAGVAGGGAFPGTPFSPLNGIIVPLAGP